MLFPQVDIDFISLFDMRNQIEYPSDIYAAANKKSHPKECDIKFCWYILEVALPILSHAHYIDPTFPSHSQYTPVHTFINRSKFSQIDFQEYRFNAPRQIQL